MDAPALTLKQQQGEQTRQRVIDSATDLFARKGFHATSMADLASATGLTKGAFYHHFATKEELFQAVVESVRATWRNAVEAEVVHHDDALERLAALLVGHARLIRRRPELCLVINGLSEEMRRTHPALARVLHGIYLDLIAFVEQVLRIGQGRGEVRRDVDPRLIAVDIVGLLRGVSCFGVLADLGLECDDTLTAVCPVLIDGLRPPRDDRREQLPAETEGEAP